MVIDLNVEVYENLLKGMAKTVEMKNVINDAKKILIERHGELTNIGKVLIDQYLADLVISCIVLFDFTYYGEYNKIEAKRIDLAKATNWYLV